jgi:hypothetical protein
MCVHGQTRTRNIDTSDIEAVQQLVDEGQIDHRIAVGGLWGRRDGSKLCSKTLNASSDGCMVRHAGCQRVAGGRRKVHELRLQVQQLSSDVHICKIRVRRH